MGTAIRGLGVLFSAILILLAFVAPACSGDGISVDIDEVVAQVAAAQTSLDTYRMDSHVSVQVLGDPAAGSKTVFTGFLDTNAAVDATHRRMQMDMTMGMGKDAESGGLKYYGQAFLIDNHLYTGVSMTQSGFQWNKVDLAADYWESAEIMEQQLALLQLSGRSLAGEESIDGAACYVFDLTPDVAQTVAAWNLQSFMGQGATLPAWKEEWVQGATVRQWIAKDTARLAKSNVQLTLRMPAAELNQSMGEGDVDITVTGEAYYHSYNGWVSIIVPPEAIQ